MDSTETKEEFSFKRFKEVYKHEGGKIYLLLNIIAALVTTLVAAYLSNVFALAERFGGQNLMGFFGIMLAYMLLFKVYLETSVSKRSLPKGVLFRVFLFDITWAHIISGISFILSLAVFSYGVGFVIDFFISDNTNHGIIKSFLKGYANYFHTNYAKGKVFAAVVLFFLFIPYKKFIDRIEKSTQTKCDEISKEFNDRYEKSNIYSEEEAEK